MHRNMSLCEKGKRVTRFNLLASLLTLVMNVLMLVHFPVHVGMCVCVNISVDIGVDLGSQSGASLSQKQLLMGNVVLIGKAVFVPVGCLRSE